MKKLLSFLTLLLCLTLAFSALPILPTAAEETAERENPLKGKSVLFVGDSICEAICENNNTTYRNIRGWAARIIQANGMTGKNLGKSGASVSTCRGPNTVVAQLTQSRTEFYDYVIMHGGVNDAWDSAPVGEMTAADNFTGPFKTSTFAGGLENMFMVARKHYSEAQLGYIINGKIKRDDVGSLSNMAPYFDVAKQICEKWGVPYLDLYNDDAYNAAINYTNPGNYVNGDGIHPTAKGYDIITPFIENWMKTLTKEPNGSPLEGLNVLFTGDSICDAYCETNAGTYKNLRGWAARVIKENGMIGKNAGVGGASMSNCRNTNTVLNQLISNVGDAHKYDMVILHGGVNDAWDNAPIGEMTAEDNFKGPFDLSTFAGGMEATVKYALEHYKKATVGYIVNFRIKRDDIGALSNMGPYFDMAKKICDKWNISYLDLFSDEDLNNNKLKVDTPTYFANSDYIHPNSKGYDILAPYISEWMKTMAPEKEPEVSEPSEALAETEAVEETTTSESTDETKSGTNVWFFVGIGCGIIVGGCVLFVLLKRKK